MSDARPAPAARNLFVDARYQVTFTLALVAVVAGLFLGLGYLATRKAEAATRIGLHQIELVGGATGEHGERLRETLLARQHLMSWGIFGAGAVLCIGLGLFGVLLTRRIAGPMRRVRQSLEGIRDGVIGPAPVVAEGHLLTDFFATYRAALDGLRERERQELAVLRRVLDIVERTPSVRADAVEALRARVVAKEKALG